MKTKRTPKTKPTPIATNSHALAVLIAQSMCAARLEKDGKRALGILDELMDASPKELKGGSLTPEQMKAILAETKVFEDLGPLEEKF